MGKVRDPEQERQELLRVIEMALPEKNPLGSSFFPRPWRSQYPSSSSFTLPAKCR
jgi:hypothetical protein